MYLMETGQKKKKRKEIVGNRISYGRLHSHHDWIVKAMTTIYQTGTEITTHISYHKHSVGEEADNKTTQCFSVWWHKMKISIYFSFKPRVQIINSSVVLSATESPQKVKRLICTLLKMSSSVHSKQSKPTLLVMAVPTPNKVLSPTSPLSFPVSQTRFWIKDLPPLFGNRNWP